MMRAVTRMANFSAPRLLAALLVSCVLPATGCAQDADSRVPSATRIPPRVVRDRWGSQIVLAERAATRGDRAEAQRLASAIVDAYVRAGNISSDEHQSAGRAYVLRMTGDANAARSALAAFDRAVAADSANFAAQSRAGQLFLEKYNAPDARASFEAVLKRSPTNAAALLGLAQVEDFEGKPTALATARRSVASDPRFAEAHAFVARLHLESEAFDSAQVHASRAVAADSGSLSGWSVLGATAWLAGDSVAYRRALHAATTLQPAPAAFYTELAEAAVRNRRYADAVQLALRAVSFDAQSVRALGVLGTNQLRTGQMDEGRATLDRAFTFDPFNVWHKNTLDLLDKLQHFRTIDRGRFRIVAPAEEAELLALYITPLLEQAYDALAKRYGYAPPPPVRLEFYRQHADFSVRAVGLAGLGALGVSFGSLLAMDTPSARERGSFNWGSTAVHELTHAFTLGASDHRVPRWLSEGISVLEERRAGRGWGADVSVPFLMASSAGRVQPVSLLNDGFLRPRYAEETQHSYYQASLFSEWVDAIHGPEALPAMLVAFRDGLETTDVMQRVLKLSPRQIDAQFAEWSGRKFATPLQALRGSYSSDSSGGRFVSTMRAAVALRELRPDSSRALFEQAQAMFPEYGADDGPAWFLARMALDRDDSTAALTLLSQITTRNETAWDANLLEADIREQRGDRVGAMAALERLLWIFPYDARVHDRLATLAAASNVYTVAVRERRAIIASAPTDLLEARFELARALGAAGDVPAARRELLDVLEQAPSFEKAQLLLLNLRSRSGTAPRPPERR